MIEREGDIKKKEKKKLNQQLPCLLGREREDLCIF
jgi:hypothetical protein